MFLVLNLATEIHTLNSRFMFTSERVMVNCNYVESVIHNLFGRKTAEPALWNFDVALCIFIVVFIQWSIYVNYIPLFDVSLRPTQNNHHHK